MIARGLATVFTSGGYAGGVETVLYQEPIISLSHIHAANASLVPCIYCTTRSPAVVSMGVSQWPIHFSRFDRFLSRALWILLKPTPSTMSLSSLLRWLGIFWQLLNKHTFLCNPWFWSFGLPRAVFEILFVKTWDVNGSETLCSKMVSPISIEIEFALFLSQLQTASGTSRWPRNTV